MAEHRSHQRRGHPENDLIRLAVHRLRTELGVASRIKPEAVVATAKASRYKLTPPRTAASAAVAVAKAPPRVSANGKTHPAKAARRPRGARTT